MIVAALLVVCPTISLPPDTKFTALLQAVQRDATEDDRVRRIEAYVKQHAVLAKQAVQLIPYARYNIAAIVFPAIVDKDAIVLTAMDQRVTIPKWYLAQPDRLDVEHARLLVGPIAQITGLALPGTLCIKLTPADDRDVTAVQREMDTQQLAADKVRIVYTALRDRLFTAQQAKTLIDAIPYHAEKVEAGRALRNRVVERAAWNQLVCNSRSEWFDCALE